MRLLYPLAFLFFLGCIGTASLYSMDGESRFHYAADRGALSFNETVLQDAPAFAQLKVFMDVGDGTVALLVWVPKTPGAHPAVLFHPGAGVTKEAGKAYADLFVAKGFVVAAVDQRGVGETSATTYSNNDDYARFLKGLEPTDHRRVFDFLRAFDYLRQRKDVDGGQIVLVGESLGGRVAVMAGAVEPRARAVVGISTSGYGLQQGQDLDSTRFLHSIDPDYYVSLISPRKFVEIHSPDDPGVPYAAGEELFSRAGEPKQFLDADCPNHGYCKAMDPVLVQAIPSLVG